jgi:SRSO17 transposase
MTAPGRDALGEFISRFRRDFRRRDRCSWARAYVEGLLAELPRKNIEGIARHTSSAHSHPVEDVRQALQNFIQESPWDDEAVLSRYWLWVRDRLPSGDRLAVEEISLVKQGNHSVGVLRQLCPESRRKLNCQILVAAFLVGEEPPLPLAMRLYLPRAWVETSDRLDRTGVPLVWRKSQKRHQLALDLIDQVRATGLPCRGVYPSDSYRHSADFREGLLRRGLALWEPAGQPADPVRRQIRRLRDEFGLDHFEGRSWRGLHHHLCLVTLAAGFCVHSCLSGISA